MGEFTSLAVVATAGLIAFTGILLRMRWEERQRRNRKPQPKPPSAQTIHSQS